MVAQAAANIAWDTRGHYLMYCVIVLANGKAIAADDKRTSVIVSDVVESYLGGTVIHARERPRAPARRRPDPDAGRRISRSRRLRVSGARWAYSLGVCG